MAVQILSLFSGSLATPSGSAGTLYTSPSSPAPLTTIVKSIRLVNTGTGAATVNLYLWRTTSDQTNRHLIPVNMTIPAGGLALDDQEITMTAGDIVKGDANASGIDCIISGIQR